MDLRGQISVTRSEGLLEGHLSGVTWLADVTQGDVDPRLRCHVSSGYGCFVDPLCPLECDMCHPLMREHVTPSPCYMSAPGMCPPGQSGW
jgi:hypothetical protein